MMKKPEEDEDDNVEWKHNPALKPTPNFSKHSSIGVCNNGVCNGVPMGDRKSSVVMRLAGVRWIEL